MNPSSFNERFAIVFAAHYGQTDNRLLTACLSALLTDPRFTLWFSKGSENRRPRNWGSVLAGVFREQPDPLAAIFFAYRGFFGDAKDHLAPRYRV